MGLPVHDKDLIQWSKDIEFVTNLKKRHSIVSRIRTGSSLKLPKNANKLASNLYFSFDSITALYDFCDNCILNCDEIVFNYDFTPSDTLDFKGGKDIDLIGPHRTHGIL